MLEAKHLEPALTEKEMILRDGFVAEYLKDFDPFKACLRMGFQPTYAIQNATLLFNDGYVQRKIAYITRIPETSPEQEAADRAMVEYNLRQLVQQGSASSRVMAIREFRSHKGWADDGGGLIEDLTDMFKRVAQELPT